MLQEISGKKKVLSVDNTQVYQIEPGVRNKIANALKAKKNYNIINLICLSKVLINKIRNSKNQY